MGSAWTVDESIAWRIVLAARATVTPAQAAGRLAALYAAQGWGSPPAVVDPDLRALAETTAGPVVVGVSDEHLAVSGDHAHVDGLGLLEVASPLTASAVTSSARGVDDRAPAGGPVAGIARRLVEVALAPPARVATPGSPGGPGDVLVALRVAHSVGTAVLVHAGVRAVQEHNAATRLRTGQVTVAVGAGRPVAPGSPLANRSALIRLRDLDDDTVDRVAQRLRTAPLDAAGGSGPPGGLVARIALRALAPRLGSTLLVSHLGTLSADGLHDPAFYPVTAGGSGLSVGAVTHGGTTMLTLRGRAARWDEPTLAALLERIAERAQV